MAVAEVTMLRKSHLPQGPGSKRWQSVLQTKIFAHGPHPSQRKLANKNTRTKGLIPIKNAKPNNRLDAKHGPYQKVNPLVHESRMRFDMYIHVHSLRLQTLDTGGQSITVIAGSEISTVLSPHISQPQLHFHLWDGRQELGQMPKVECSLKAKGKVGCGAVHLYEEQNARYQIFCPERPKETYKREREREKDVPVRQEQHSSSSSTLPSRPDTASATAAESALPQTTLLET